MSEHKLDHIRTEARTLVYDTLGPTAYGLVSEILALITPVYEKAFQAQERERAELTWVLGDLTRTPTRIANAILAAADDPRPDFREGLGYAAAIAAAHRPKPPPAHFWEMFRD